MNKIRSTKGITLISLVITIVVLIVLASVTIYLNLGNNGIVNKAKEAKEVTNKQTATELINLKITNCQMNKYAEEQRMPTLKELSEILKKDNEIQYVTETSKIAATEYNVPSENPSSIYTKLNKYPYEFEINSSLQLASVDGVKLANSNSNKKELLWKTEEEGIQEVILEKNIKDYDFIMVYCYSIYSKQELIFDTSESYEQELNYANNGPYVINTIKLDLNKNSITMSMQSTDKNGGSAIYNGIKKIIGIKL